MSSRPRYQELLSQVRKHFPEPPDGIQERVRELGSQLLETLAVPGGRSDRPETIGLPARALELIGRLLAARNT